MILLELAAVMLSSRNETLKMKSTRNTISPTYNIFMYLQCIEMSDNSVSLL